MTTEERLERVERELLRVKRRSRWLLATLSSTAGALTMAWIFVGASPALQAQAGAGAERVVRANRFVLEDENGKTRAVLGATGTGLSMYDEKGTLRAWLSVFEDGAWLTLYDKKGDPRALLGASKDGPRLNLVDEDRRVRAWLSVLKDGPGLSLLDENGKAIWSAP